MSSENYGILNRSYRNLSDDNAQNVRTKTPLDLLATIENFIIPKALLQHLRSDFEDFAEEWVEITQSFRKTHTKRSDLVSYLVKVITDDEFEFENSLHSSFFFNSQGHEVQINHLRKELILTDGEISKQGIQRSQNPENLSFQINQKIKVKNPSFVVVLERDRIKREDKSLSHQDTITIYLSDHSLVGHFYHYLEQTKSIFSSSKSLI